MRRALLCFFSSICLAAIGHGSSNIGTHPVRRMENRPLEHQAHAESSPRVKRPPTKDISVQGRSPSRRLRGLATDAVSDRILLNSSTELADSAFLTNTIDPAGLLAWRPGSGTWYGSNSGPVNDASATLAKQWGATALGVNAFEDEAARNLNAPRLIEAGRPAARLRLHPGVTQPMMTGAPTDLMFWRPASGVWDRANSRPVTGDASRLRGLLPTLHGTISASGGTDDGQVGDVDEPVFWANVVGASVSGNTLTKTATTTAWDAGAASANLIRDGYGYVEFTKTETSGRIMAGLSNGNSGVAYEDVDYAIHSDALGNVHIFEAGAYRGQFGTYVAGDRFRVEVRYGVVRYFRNGQLLYTSAVPPKYPLRVDAELYDPGVSVTDVRIGSSTWTHDAGVAVSGSSLRKTGAAGWTSGAVSANTLEAGDGATEFTATETNTTRRV